MQQVNMGVLVAAGSLLLGASGAGLPEASSDKLAYTFASTCKPLALLNSTSTVERPDGVSEARTAQAPHRNSQMLAIGDRLKVAVFERLDAVTADRIPVASKAQGGRVERPDLGGDVTIEADGSLCLGILDCVEGTGRPQRDVEGQLARAYSAGLGQQIEVSIAVVEREPIYVLGAVSRPGTYRYSPALTVSHAIALSGSFEGENMDASRASDILREDERSARALERLKHLLVRQASLAGNQEPGNSDAPKRLRELGSVAEVEAMLLEARRARGLLQERRKGELSGVETSLAKAQQELEILKEKLRIVSRNLKDREERSAAIASLQGRSYQLLSARSEASDVAERRLELRAVIVATEAKLQELRQSRTRLQVDAEIEDQRELDQLKHEIALEEGALFSSRKLVKTILGPARLTLGDNAAYRFEVKRRTPTGLSIMVVDESFLLQPGDLLRISRVSPTAG